MGHYLFLGYGDGNIPLSMVFSNDVISYQNSVRQRNSEVNNSWNMQDIDHVKKILDIYNKIYVSDSGIMNNLTALGIEREKLSILDIPENFEKNKVVLKLFLEEKIKGLKP